jgi:hypothetical protein
VRVPERRGLLIADPEHPSLNGVPDCSLDHLQAASLSYRIAIGPHAGRKALTLYSLSKQPKTRPKVPEGKARFVTTRQKEPNEKGFVGYETSWEPFQKEVDYTTLKKP